MFMYFIFKGFLINGAGVVKYYSLELGNPHLGRKKIYINLCTLQMWMGGNVDIWAIYLIYLFI